MTTEAIKFDTAVKSILDNVAKNHGYPEGKLDSDKGILTYDVSTPVLGFQEALNRVLFRNDVASMLKDQPEMSIIANFNMVTIKLPDWENVK